MDFHKKCDNIPKTLTIIKAKSGNIFGGYTEATWNQSNQFKKDKNAFLFSLINEDNNPVKVKIAEGQEDRAIFCGPSFLAFGDGYDIVLSTNPASKNSSSKYFGTTYVLANYLCGTKKAQTFLAGSDSFRTEEIEVFRLI